VDVDKAPGEEGVEDQVVDQAASGDAGEVQAHGSRAEERIRKLADDREQDRREHQKELAQLREEVAFLKGRSTQTPAQKDRLQEIAEIENSDDRVAAYLQHSHDRVSKLERSLEEERAARAHEKRVGSSLRGLEFGDETASMEAMQIVELFAKQNPTADARKFAEALAQRFNPKKEAKKDKQAAEAAAYAARKRQDADATRRVPPASSAPPGSKKDGEPPPRKSSKELFREGRQSYDANRQAKTAEG
jgi:hypothetical protein